MNLVADWRRVLKRAWSIRLWALATLILFIEPLVQLAIDLSAGWSLAVQIILRLTGSVLGLLGIWARVVKQKEFEDADEDKE